MSELYRDDDLLVRFVGEGSGGRLIVTFGNWSSKPKLDRLGFAEPFCRKYGLDAVHVTCSRNHWFQVPGISRALANIASFASDYESIVTYGVSMGGYQAVRAVAPLRAEGCVAFSPQFSVDPAKVPWENRWPTDRASIKFNEGPLLQRFGAKYLLIYDPWEPLDRRHVDAIKSCVQTTDLKLPFSRHDTMFFLTEAGLLSQTALSLLTGKRSPQSMRGQIRNGRHRSPTYFGGISRIQRFGLPDRANALEKAVALDPSRAKLWLQLASLYIQLNDVDRARASATGAETAGAGGPSLHQLHEKIDRLVQAGPPSR